MRTSVIRRGLSVVLFALLVAPAAGHASPTRLAAAGGTGLRGLVTKGPITPVCRAETPCSAPAARVTITFLARGLAKSVTTGANGRYLILLPAGTYAVRIPSARFGAKPRVATVVAGRM